MTTPTNPRFNHTKYRAFPRVTLDDRQYQALGERHLVFCGSVMVTRRLASDVEQKKQMWALLVRMGFTKLKSVPSAT